MHFTQSECGATEITQQMSNQEEEGSTALLCLIHISHKVVDLELVGSYCASSKKVNFSMFIYLQSNNNYIVCTYTVGMG